MQLPLFEPKSEWKAPQHFVDFKNAKRIGLDIETCDPGLKKLGPGTKRNSSYIVGVSIAIDGGPTYYYPIRHAGGGNLDAAQTLAWLKDQAADFGGEVVGANLIYDMDFLAEEGVHFFFAKCFYDVQIAEALIDENLRSYSLESLCQRYLGIGKDESILEQAALEYGVDPKGDMWQLPAKFIGQYAEADALYPLQILEQQEQIINAQNLGDIWQLESDLFPAMLAMHRKGIRVDQDALAQCEVAYLQEEVDLVKEIKARTLVDLTGDLWKSGAIAGALGAVGMTTPLTLKTGKPSVTAGWLKAQNDPVANLIKQARQANKVRTTFCESIKRHMVGDIVYPNFRQLKGEAGGTITGRLSCAIPNIQQQPKAKVWRNIYIPEDGAQFGRFDYKQQEPRLTLHYARELGLPRTREICEEYRRNPDIGCYEMVSKTIPKKDLKIAFLGTTYGMGTAKLCTDLGFSFTYDENGYAVPGPEGERFLRNFHQTVPYLKKLTQRCKNVAERRGYITTLLGRRCRFPNGEFTHKATNKLIQGSAADQTKKALLDCYKAGYTPHIQVHDEIDFSIESQRQAKEIKEIMETTVKLHVPVRVDVGLADRWGEYE